MCRIYQLMFAFKFMTKFNCYYEMFLILEVVYNNHVDGIVQFWDSVSGEKCRKYIRHLQKVIPRVIEFGGAVTEY